MKPGVAFPHQHPHEAVHLAPLWDRLRDVLVAPVHQAAVVVHATTQPPVAGAWNVQVFHGLGDKGYVCNPLFLQKGRRPRLRTALNMPLARLRLPAPFLQAPANPGRRPGRYEQVNAYGPRFADAFERMLRDTRITRFGHVAMNEREGLTHDPEGPVLFLPTWDNRAYWGGPSQSCLVPFADEVAGLAAQVPVLVKYHPLTVRHGQAKAVRRRFEETAGLSVADPSLAAYDLMQGVRGVLTDSSSLGFEAYCAGLPVAIAKPDGVVSKGLHAELEQRVPVHTTRSRSVAAWAESPETPSDTAWARDLMDAPHKSRNDAFAAQLRQAVVEHTSGVKW